MAEYETLPSREALLIDEVLVALGHPVRLRVVRTLADGRELSCQEILPDMTKSSASHHWKVLRESGVIHQRREGRYLRTMLRREDLDARFPGLLDAVVQG
ncbi:MULTISPECIES: helix-turn-helix domain-containing protein [unclassified Streptomyces]|uniref:ArsR/SmtB family transcription factor n=1 Tax=unclassified Streptomyces TaxID=2593676 RepID=UPI002DDB89CC|nr:MULTISPECIES: helix-turn-helix domain-containing protein [unclassified Streptomyces]WSA94633.1 helix-turn-helix domain-containing protein [Streptomyces sp. NBC_01795]WSB79053.1 helix-turn-helix domain-containing protein [Streptomyces sp. NBC_01775]WSS12747.1 helix-turn-helix domain-containing protein [Streptomyces sp. NBC_01186]WSS41530.1 helix-turn-helix domain-containing protein [Streptomyces sp. NBC_01187]